MKLSELIELHKDFESELEIVKVSYEEIGSVFEKFRDRFLLYCDVVSKIQLMMRFLADQKENNPDVRLDIYIVTEWCIDVDI